MKIKTVSIKDPNIGEITIHSELPVSVNDIIGTIAPDHSNFSYYFANISKSEYGVFEFRNVKVVKPKSFIVGFHNTSGGSKNFTMLYINKPVGDFDIYPNAITSIIYDEDENPTN